MIASAEARGGYVFHSVVVVIIFFQQKYIFVTSDDAYCSVACNKVQICSCKVGLKFTDSFNMVARMLVA